jgi:hypothetical protein
MKLTKILFLSLIASCNSSDPKVESNTPPVAILYDLTKIYNQSKSDVEAYLGKAEKSEHKKDKYPCKGSECDKYFFKNDSIEIIFTKDKAKWISIELPPTKASDNGLPFGIAQKHDAAIPSGGFRWNDVNGMELTASITDGKYDALIAKDKAIQ